MSRVGGIFIEYPVWEYQSPLASTLIHSNFLKSPEKILLLCMCTVFQILRIRFSPYNSVKPHHDFEEFPEVLGLSLKIPNASGKKIFMILFSLEKSLWSTMEGKEEITEVTCVFLLNNMICWELISY